MPASTSREVLQGAKSANGESPCISILPLASNENPAADYAIASHPPRNFLNAAALLSDFVRASHGGSINTFLTLSAYEP